MIVIDYDKCIYCGKCLSYCNFDAIDFDREKKSIAINELCVACGRCIKPCPKDAIRDTLKTDLPAHLKDRKGILVWAELETSPDDPGRIQVREVVFEILTKARMLKEQTGEKLALAVIGDRMPDMDEIKPYAIDEVYLVSKPELSQFVIESFTTALFNILATMKPSIVLIGATSQGRSLAPRIAARLHTGITADCTALEIDSQNNLVQIRPAFGGNIMASIVCPRSRPQIATIRPHTFMAKPALSGNNPVLTEVIVDLTPDDLATTILTSIVEGGPKIDIREADILISVGKGIGSKENIKIAERLSEKLGGLVTGSRAVVEMGWIEHTRQVGQSGKTVSPRLYIALGISGAIQHITGMRSAEHIIAVNTDAEAPIFKYADVGIIGDCVSFCENLISKFD